MIYLLLFIVLVCLYQLFGFGIEICFNVQEKAFVIGFHANDFPLFCIYFHHLTIGLVILGVGFGLGFQWKDQ